MPPYHSAWDKAASEYKEACGCAMLPIREPKAKGPAPKHPVDDGTLLIPVYSHPPRSTLTLTRPRRPHRPRTAEREDIVNETLIFFRANILFKSYQVHGSADRTLLYLTMYITKCLQIISKCKSRKEAESKLYNVANESFAIPGDSRFPLGGFMTAPKNSKESTDFRAYMSQARVEIGHRLIARCYLEGDGGEQNKWWLCFSKRKFLGKTMP